VVFAALSHTHDDNLVYFVCAHGKYSEIYLPNCSSHSTILAIV
jgi:hypothetical protein